MGLEGKVQESERTCEGLNEHGERVKGILLGIESHTRARNMNKDSLVAKGGRWGGTVSKEREARGTP